MIDRRAAVHTFMSILGSVLAILACGGAGALAGASLIAVAGISGTFGAIVALLVATVVATLCWLLGAAALRALGWLR